MSEFAVYFLHYRKNLLFEFTLIHSKDSCQISHTRTSINDFKRHGEIGIEGINMAVTMGLCLIILDYMTMSIVILLYIIRLRMFI